MSFSLGIDINDYDYVLPDERIAKYPLPQRDQSKLLIYSKGSISHAVFHQITDYLNPGHILVYNNTRVIQARMQFRKPSGAIIEIFCLEPYEPSDYSIAFQQTGVCTWKCLVGNAKKWKENPLQKEMNTGHRSCTLKAEKIVYIGNSYVIRFSWDPADIPFGRILEKTGLTPIPPYLKREAEPADVQNYQTVYSRIDGSVAAPTAGFHFTQNILDRLLQKGIIQLQVTLHIGAGTFQPVIESDVLKHSMHTEHIYITREVINSVCNNFGNIVAVGTTSARTLETLYWLGVKIMAGFVVMNDDLHLDQWEAYDLIQDISVKESLTALTGYLENNDLKHLEALTKLIIIPGYRFRIVNHLITNFHQPKSTLLLLIAAFIGNDWKKVYRYAMENDFRFLSYGDSSFLLS